MTRVLVLYYSSYGHIERMAQVVAEGARDAAAETDIKRVPELVPENVAKRSGYKVDQVAPDRHVAELPNYDAIIFGSGTRFGAMTNAQFPRSNRLTLGKARLLERWGRYSRVLEPSMAVRNRPFSQ
jgi:flavodoxin